MDDGPQEPEVPLLPGKGERTREEREATVPVSATRDARAETAVVPLRGEGEGLERSVGLEQNDLESGGGETVEGGSRGQEEQGETEPDEEGQVRRDFLVETERAKGEGGGDEGERGREGSEVAAATVLRRRRALLHPHREAYIRGRHRSHGTTQT